MDSPATTSARDRSAIVCSIAAHICALVLIAAVARPVFKPPPELLSRAGVFTVTLVPRPVRRGPRVAPVVLDAAPVASPQPARAARPAAAVARATPFARSAARLSISAPSNMVTGTVLADTRTARPAVPPVPAATPAPTPPETAAPAAIPTTAPAAVAAVSTPAAGPVPGEGGLFGKNYRAIPNPPTALSAIRAKIAGHFHIRVHVDEAGHAIDVRFLSPMMDAAVAEDVRSRLLAMNFIPADCNGLPCSDDLDIAY